MQTITILGSGGWGTALAAHLGRLGKEVRLWGIEADVIAETASSRENRVYLPGIKLPEVVMATTDLEQALAGSDCVVSAVPSHGVREVLRRSTPYLPPGIPVVSATKGLEVGSLLRMSQVIEEEVPDDHAVVALSGPSFALEVARGAPTAVCVAGRSPEVVERVQEEFRSRYFRLYGTDDVIGVEIGGALKNVIAIAAGVVESLGLGHNALSALITRGLAEIGRVACAVGGRRETLSGLSGLGDLVLTCTGQLSRNRQVGVELGMGRRLDEILSGMRMVAEGIKTTGVALDLGRRYEVELPIALQMFEVLEGRKDPRTAVEDLMLRPQRLEHEGLL